MTQKEKHRATSGAARRFGKPFPSVATVCSRARRRRPRSTSGSSCRPVVISSAAVAAVTSASSGGGAGGAEGEAPKSSEPAPAASPSSRPRARNAERGGGGGGGRLQRPGGGPEAADRGLAGAGRLVPSSCCRERREEASQTEGEKERDASCRAPKSALERPPSGLGEGRAAARDSAEESGSSAGRLRNAAPPLRRNAGEPSHSSSEWACHKGSLRPAGR